MSSFNLFMLKADFLACEPDLSAQINSMHSLNSDTLNLDGEFIQTLTEQLNFWDSAGHLFSMNLCLNSEN